MTIRRYRLTRTRTMVESIEVFAESKAAAIREAEALIELDGPRRLDRRAGFPTNWHVHEPLPIPTVRNPA